MKRTVIFIAFFALVLRGVSFAQNPYQSIGKEMPKGKMLTLSNGKFQEFFPNDTLVPIGSVMYNTVTGEVVAFLTRDTMYAEYNLEPELVSRWLSPDPLAHKFTEWSPYNFSYNNPLRFVDPDGRAAQDHIIVNNKGEILDRKVDPNIHKVTVINTSGKVAGSFDRLVANGTTYNVEGVLKVAASSAKDIVKVDKKGNVTNEPGCQGCTLTDMQGKGKQGIAREHGTYLRDNGAEVVAGPENVIGDPKMTILNAPSGDVVGTAHVHPNTGKGAFRLGGTATIPNDNRGPSDIDKTTQAPPQAGYLNIVIDNKNIYFYDRDKTITIPRSKL